jgi:hypothetical protein
MLAGDCTVSRVEDGGCGFVRGQGPDRPRMWKGQHAGFCRHRRRQGDSIKIHTIQIHIRYNKQHGTEMKQAFV